jgi:UDP-N-acetylmuramoylalanine--D-glutamate ligase
MGLGRFGGALGAVRYLAERGADLLVTDLRTEPELKTSLEQLADLPGVTYHLGGHLEEDFTSCDLVVASAAIPLSNRYLELARSRGIPITREMNLFWERNPGRVVAVTGTNGKSTTTALTHALLSQAFPGRVWLGGNIGKSLLPDVEKIRPGDWVVLELSSFQLEDLAVLRPNAQVSIVTNFSANHLDRHPSLDAYRAAKQQLLACQSTDRIAVLNQDDPDVSQWPTGARRFWFGSDDIGREGMFLYGADAFPRRAIFRLGLREQVFPLGDWLTLAGRHNVINALAACSAALLLGTQAAQIEAGIRSFTALPHRLELVGEVGGVRYFNDSKATTPAAAILALRSFRAPCWVIVGGYDKQIDLNGLVAEIVAHPPRGVACVGQVGPALAAQLKQAAAEKGCPLHLDESGTLSHAVAWCAAQAQPGEVVLLSPGCASYDQFENYEERGLLFARLVAEQAHVATTSSTASSANVATS